MACGLWSTPPPLFYQVFSKVGYYVTAVMIEVVVRELDTNQSPISQTQLRKPVTKQCLGYNHPGYGLHVVLNSSAWGSGQAHGSDAETLPRGKGRVPCFVRCAVTGIDIDTDDSGKQRDKGVGTGKRRPN